MASESFDEDVLKILKNMSEKSRDRIFKDNSNEHSNYEKIWNKAKNI